MQAGSVILCPDAGCSRFRTASLPERLTTTLYLWRKAMKRLLSSLVLCGLLLTPCAAADVFAAPAQGSAPAVQQKSTPAGTPAVQQKGSGFRGNPASKVYHNSGCRYFNSKGASKTFATQQEAVKAGYRPCKVCNG